MRPRRPRRLAAFAPVLLAAALGCGGPSTPPRQGAPSAAGGPRALRVLPDRVEGRALLLNDAGLAARAGAGPLQVLGADMVAEGERVGAFVEIPDGECMLAVARASPTIGDVDLFAYDDEGSTFSADEAADPRASILVCPPHPRRLYVVARVIAGAGALGIGVQSVPVPAADAVAQAVGARGRPGDDSGRLESWPGLETKIRAHRASLGGRWDDARRAAVPVGARTSTRVGLTVEPGRCADVLVVPSEEIGSLEVVVEDVAGRIVARAREREQDRFIVLCAAAQAELSIAVRARGSQGLVAVVIGRSPAGVEPEIAGAIPVARVTETRELADARAAHDRALKASGFGAPKASTSTARAGSRTTVPVELPAGCARVDVLAGRPLGEFLAELWSAQGELVAIERGGSSATLYGCGAGGAARLDIEALARPGPFAVEVRKDPAAPQALVAHPIAAARLLGRLQAGAGGAGVTAAAATAAQVIQLDAARLRSIPLAVPAQGCVEVIAALDREGAGLELRLLDSSTGESSLVRGRHLVSDRRCAPRGATAGAAEIRLGSGKGDALVLVRPSPGS